MRDVEFTSSDGFRLSGTALERARQALAAHADFRVERYTADGMDARFYYILFDETSEAQQLVNDLAAAVQGLPEQNRTAVQRQVYVQRRANFVVIGVSHHVFRDFPRTRFRFPEEARSLI